jgi:hypothetical protein
MEAIGDADASERRKLPASSSKSFFLSRQIYLFIYLLSKIVNNSLNNDYELVN